MSMSAREQQKLACIAGQLAGSDPELAALMATFTRLTMGEDMPAREVIRAGWRAPRGQRVRRRGRWPRARRVFRPAAPLPWLLAAIVVTAAVLVAVTMALATRGGGRRCVTVGFACISQVAAHPAGSPPAKAAAGPALRASW